MSVFEKDGLKKKNSSCQIPYILIHDDLASVKSNIQIEKFTLTLYHLLKRYIKLKVSRIQTDP